MAVCRRCFLIGTSKTYMKTLKGSNGKQHPLTAGWITCQAPPLELPFFPTCIPTKEDAEELWAPDRNPASYNSMYSVSTRRITAPARGEPAPIYLLSKIQLQALSLPKCYCLLLWCILNLFYPFQKKDESIHFYPVRNMNSHLNWRVTKHKEESLY